MVALRINRKKSKLIITRFNGRKDNLGDLLIHRCLWDFCKDYGELIAYGPSPGFLEYPAIRFRFILWRVLWAIVSGRSIILMEPPGARGAIPVLNSDTNIKGKLINYLWDLVNPYRVRVGISIAGNFDPQDMRHHTWIGVRDYQSLRILHEKDLAQARYCPDLAFLLEPKTQEFSPNEKVLLSFRARIPEEDYGLQYEQRLREVIPALVHVIGNYGLSTEFYYQVDEDQSFCADLRELSMPEGSGEFNKAGLRIEQLFKQFSDVGLVLSNRLHVLLEGAAFGSLPVVVTSARHDKLCALFSSVGWDRLILDIADSSRCQAQLLRLLECRQELRDRVYGDFKRNGIAARTHLQKMFELIQ